ALAGGRIERRAATVVRDLESAILVAWNSVPETLADVGPDGEASLVVAALTRRRPEVEHLLSRRAQKVGEHFGKKRREPRAAREDERLRCECEPILQLERAHLSVRDGTRT